MHEYIEIYGAREHNLKNISLKIPKNKIVAVTGSSGSGKSTFAMDILQRECQRQYIESMGLVTDGMNKAKVDKIIGLSPSISISQGINNRNPRSTVGTFTEISTYIRVLYAKCGERLCPKCSNLISPIFNAENMIEENNQISCSHCDNKLDTLTMAHFSFNKQEGFCKSCSGLGEINDIDPSSIVNENLSVGEGAVSMWKAGTMANHYEAVLHTLSRHYELEFNPKKAIKDFTKLERLIFYYGVDSEEFIKMYPDIVKPKKVNDGYFEGILTFLRKKSAESLRKGTKNKNIEACFVKKTCPDCNGSRLNKDTRDIKVNGKNIVEISAFTLEGLSNWIESLPQNIHGTNDQILFNLIFDIKKRIKAVTQLGLSYLSLERKISSLSGGEAQRLRMAGLMDSGLTGVLYILDEPTTGLHAKDTLTIFNALVKLRDMGNTILVIDHDMDFISKCDYVIDFGPGSGIHGGEVIASGTPKELSTFKDSITGKYLNKKTALTARANHIDYTMHEKNSIKIVGASEHNLKNIDVSIPLKKLVAFTGVSGSGKSTLLFDILVKSINTSEGVKTHKVCGLENIDRLIVVNQKTIGRSSRSTVATYTDIFTSVRAVFSKQKKGKESGLKPGDFSFNNKGGRCEKCKGLGTIPLDMHFLDDIEVTCPICKGKRFNQKILKVKYKGYTVSDILDMTVDQCMDIFEDNKDILARLRVLEEVGLGYLTLGQSTSTLSGGECQRIKLSKELGKLPSGHTLYILDEPTTGLHPSDSDKLIQLFKKLVNRGNSIMFIEHSIDVICHSDWIIDLGPEGGTKGGEIVTEGNPLEIINNQMSHTMKFIRKAIEKV